MFHLLSNSNLYSNLCKVTFITFSRIYIRTKNIIHEFSKSISPEILLKKLIMSDAESVAVENPDAHLFLNNEQAYEPIKSKIEVLDVVFHPTESNIVTTALMNGRIKMLA